LAAIPEQRFPLTRYSGVCEVGTNASVCSGIILENDETRLEGMGLIKRCNAFSLNFFMTSEI
jgi:hypothetical protein